MNASKTLVTLIVAVCLIAPLAWADWIPSDGHKMHYPQLPDPSGWDVNAMVDQVFARKLADDWRCSESGPVKDIHFWGSFQHNDVFHPLMFQLEIWDNVPKGADGSFSHPGQRLWTFTADDVGIVPVDPPSMQGWFDPFTDLVLPDDHDSYFQYNVVDIPQPFHQTEGEVYWLAISAHNVVGPAPVQWGWKTSASPQFMDDAVWADFGAAGAPQWNELLDPML